MKKFTFIIALLSVAIFSFGKDVKSYADDTKNAISTLHQDVKEAASIAHEDLKDVTSTLYGDGKEVVSTLYPEVKSAVIQIAKAIGVAAEHVYGVLVKKFVVDGLVQLLPFLFGLLLLGIGWYKTSHYFKKEFIAQEYTVRWNFLYPLAMVVAGIVMLSKVDYNTMVMGLVNPEYGALNYILEYSKEMLK